jgi:phthiocerol/phenolphthiocerol synthesis type-I polyketide synthase D
VASTNLSGSGKGIDFGLIFFSSSEAPFTGDKYRLVIESTRFADQHGFSSVWIPERHFTKDGWLYPNPAVLQAALARETKQIHLRAGSVVMPLHNPLRVAEEWAMVDNLSGGRAGLSFASGWHPNDFALFPENYATRNEVMYEGIETVRRLWRGESVQVKGGDGNLVELRTYPTPIQPELPVWITAAGNPKTFAGAGKIGAHVLTHMYNHSVDELAEKIRIYRESLAEHGYDPAQGQVAVMLHTFVGADEQTVREQIREPFGEYLKSAAYLVNAIAYSRGQKVDLNSLSPQDLQDYLLFVTERLVSNQRVLFGTPQSCRETVALLQQAGVTEIACQIDFGIDINLVLAHMSYIDELRNLCNRPSREPVIPPHEPGSSNGKHTGSNHPVALLTAPAVETVPVAPTAPAPVPVLMPMHEVVIPIAPTPAQTPSESDALPDVRRRCQEEVSLTDFYQFLSEHGIQLGVSYQGIERLWRRDGEALGQIRLPAPVEQDAELYHIHPVLLDASFQVITAALPTVLTSGESALYLPTGIRSFQVHKRPGKFVWSHARVRGNVSSGGLIEGDVRILDERGQLLAEAIGLQLLRSEPLPTTPEKSVGEFVPAANQSLHDWLYELQWQETTLPALPTTTEPGHWLIFADKQGIGDRLGEQLIARGSTFTKIVPGKRYGTTLQGTYQLQPGHADEMQRLLQDVCAVSSTPLRGVVHLWSLDATPAIATSVATLEHDQLQGTGSALDLISALATAASNALPRLWLVTRGAQPVGESTEMLEIAQSPLWGLGRTCAMEHPELWGGLIDLDAESSRDETARQLLQAVITDHQEDQLAFRQQRSYIARMVRIPSLTPRQLTVRHDSSYIISGGLWGLGLVVARWLARQGAGQLVLLGRTTLPPRSEWDHIAPGSRIAQQIAGLRELEGMGVLRVQYVALDVADETQLGAFLRNFVSTDNLPVRGVIHAASVWQDAQGQSLVRPLANSSARDLQTLFRPKVLGGWLLHTLLQDAALDFFVSFSSGASLFGSAAQGNYAAAGEFLDILAHYQRAQGQPALSIDWGAVSETGFGATAEGLRVHEYWEERGIQRITPAQVLEVLELLIPQERARAGVLKLDWRLLQQFYPQITSRPVVAHLVPIDAVSGQDGKGGQGAERDSVLQTILGASQSERLKHVQEYLSVQVAKVLRVSVNRLDVAQPLTALGLDSLMAIELKNRIELELNVRIPIVTFLQGPSIEQFSIQVLDQIQAANASILAQKTEVPAGPEAVSAAENVPQRQEDSQSAATVELELQQQDAAELLAQLDQLSDQDVEALLGQMLVEEDGRGKQKEQHRNGHHITVTGRELTPISPQEAERLLTQLDQLSDSEVDSLLSQIVQQGGESK